MSGNKQHSLYILNSPKFECNLCSRSLIRKYHLKFHSKMPLELKSPLTHDHLYLKKILIVSCFVLMQCQHSYIKNEQNVHK